MALISISGICRKKPKQTKATKQAKKRAKVLVVKKKLLTTIKKAGKVAVKYNPAVATARNAFLGLVSLNALNLAKRLNLMLVKNPKKLMDFWTALSGKFSALQSAINTGKNKKAIIGVVAVATATATATPILIKVMKFLEENGISKDDIKKVVNKVVAKAIDKKITKEAIQKVEEQEAKEEEEEVSEQAPEETTEDTSTEDTSTEDTSTEDTSTENEQIGYYI